VPYLHATARRDYGDLASGHVLRSAPGYPAFPVRLAEELFLRAAGYLDGPIRLWDPCCGSGYLATVVGLLHRERLAGVRCTDIDPGAVELAGRNLALLTGAGLAERERELRDRAERFGKPGYLDAAESAIRLATRLRAAGGDLEVSTAVVDLFAPEAYEADLVIGDVPYGVQTTWRGATPAEGDPVAAAVRSLCAALPARAVVALCAPGRRVELGDLPVRQRFRLGNRAAVLVRAGEACR
jgi:hypothetical protein